MGDRARRATLCLGAALLVLGGCSGDDDGTDDDSSVITDPVETSETTATTSTSSTTETTADPEAGVKAEVEEAYLAYLDAFLEIFAAPNPSNPLIEQHTTSLVREVTLDAISEDILNGTSVRPPEDPADYSADVSTVTVSGNTATLEACVVDGSVVVQNATGEVLNDAVSTLHLEVVMQYEGGLWKAAESQVVSKVDGRTTCG